MNDAWESSEKSNAERAEQLVRSVDTGRRVAEALRYLHGRAEEHGSPAVAQALARFLVARCESNHAGWRVLRQIVVESSSDAPWERCARRAVGPLTQDLLDDAIQGRRTPLVRAQHLAAQRRAEQIAPFVDAAAVLSDLGLPRNPVTREQWTLALSSAVGARSREQVARAVQASLRN